MLNTFKPSIIGASGFGLLAIPQIQTSDLAEIIVALVTTIAQLVSLFKRKKKEPVQA